LPDREIKIQVKVCSIKIGLSMSFFWDFSGIIWGGVERKAGKKAPKFNPKTGKFNK